MSWSINLSGPWKVVMKEIEDASLREPRAEKCQREGNRQRCG